jgi:hypothetical protein
VVLRGPEGEPAVIMNAPLLDDGTPMPTLFWLVDARLREAVSRLEAGGGVKQAEGALSATAVAEAHERYRAEGGGGTRRGVKCLHAHLAWYLVGGDDPVGAWVEEQLGLDRAQYVVTRRDGP